MAKYIDNISNNFLLFDKTYIKNFFNNYYIDDDKIIWIKDGNRLIRTNMVFYKYDAIDIRFNIENGSGKIIFSIKKDNDIICIKFDRIRDKLINMFGVEKTEEITSLINCEFINYLLFNLFFNKEVKEDFVNKLPKQIRDVLIAKKIFE